MSSHSGDTEKNLLADSQRDRQTHADNPTA